MKDVVSLEGDELKDFLEHLESVYDADIRRVRFAIDDIDGGVKFKVNEESWSPPYGKMVK